MWEIFSSFHSFFLFPFPRKRESPCFCRLWRGIRAAGAGVGRFPLSREWGYGGNGGDDKNGGLGGCPLWRGIRAVGAGVGRFPLSREWGVVFLLFFLFPSLLPLSVSSPASAFCFLPRSRFLFPLLLPLSVSFPAPAFCSLRSLSCFRFSAPTSALPPLLPLPPLSHSRESGNLPLTGAGRATPALHRLFFVGEFLQFGSEASRAGFFGDLGELPPPRRQ